MLKSLFHFVSTGYRLRHVIFSLAKRDIQSRYVGSLLGFFWAFIHPLIMICLYWFVFTMGFKVQPVDQVPFVIWFTAGLAIWSGFAETIGSSTSVIVEQQILVKKTILPPQILPLVKIFSAALTHGIYLLFLMGLIVFHRITPSLYWLQGGYYYFCMVVLALGISLATSSMNVFLRDIAPLVNLILQLGFWLTPIFWNPSMMPPRLHWLIKLNPVYYLVEGYRNSFLYGVPFWHQKEMCLYFWGVTLCAFFLGNWIFNRLKPQFAEVL